MLPVHWRSIGLEKQKLCFHRRKLKSPRIVERLEPATRIIFVLLKLALGSNKKFVLTRVKKSFFKKYMERMEKMNIQKDETKCVDMELEMAISSWRSEQHGRIVGIRRWGKYVELRHIGMIDTTYHCVKLLTHMPERQKIQWNLYFYVSDQWRRRQGSINLCSEERLYLDFMNFCANSTTSC